MSMTGARIAMSHPPSPSHRRSDQSTSTPSNPPPDPRHNRKAIKALALFYAVLIPLGLGAESSATFPRQLLLLMYGIGSCTFCVYVMGLNIDPALLQSVLGRWHTLMHFILLLVGSISDVFVMAHAARDPKLGKFSYCPLTSTSRRIDTSSWSPLARDL